MKFYSFQIVIEKEPEDDGILRIQSNAARLLQQRQDDRRDPTQHA